MTRPCPPPGQSYEAWIESKAGACPPRDWPMPNPPPYPADDEGQATPTKEAE
jgi:hypothetical protein